MLFMVLLNLISFFYFKFNYYFNLISLLNKISHYFKFNQLQ